MSQKDSRRRNPNPGSQNLRFSPSDVRRERARLAQQRSRARTRTELQTLHARVELQSNAIDEITKIFLDFANESLAQYDVNDNEPAVRRIKDYMQRFLATARNVLEADAENSAPDQDDGSESSPDIATASGSALSDTLQAYLSDTADSAPPFSGPTSWMTTLAPGDQSATDVISPSQLHTTIAVSSRPNTTSPSNLPTATPRLTYGILRPFFDTKTRETRKFLVDRHNVQSFAVKLYWNAVSFGTTMLASNGATEASVGNQIFCWALQHELRPNLINLLRRRLNQVPSRSLLFTSAAAHTSATSSSNPSPMPRFYERHSQSASGSESDASELEEEAQILQYIQELNQKVLKSMSEAGEDEKNYLDVFAVQSRFLNTWGIDATAGDLQDRRNQVETRELGFDYESQRAYSSPYIHHNDQYVNLDHIIEDSDQEYTNGVTVAPPSSTHLQRLNESLPHLHVPPAIQNYWAAEAMTNLWSSIIMRLSVHGRCLGNTVKFPVSIVDEAARGVLLAGAA